MVQLGKEQLRVVTRPHVETRTAEYLRLQLQHDHIDWLDAESGRAIAR